MKKQRKNAWDANLYDKEHDFVAQYGTDVVELLAPKRGEIILDLGCGTGYLTEAIAETGAEVLGIDSAQSMITEAEKNYPKLNFKVIDGEKLPFNEQFDAVFSNAALHWMKNAEAVVTGIWRSLKPQGRFVAEFGGKGNVETIVKAIDLALEKTEYADNITLNPWYFPSIGEYAGLLEKQGFEVHLARLFDRPTPLKNTETGLQNWLRMFANPFFKDIPEEKILDILSAIEQETRPQLYRDNTWLADYRRLRIIAIK
ncbi:methyltransferase domain-containing protein [Spirulina sp. 06S082]|uniref:methyltransferase domain-containing protein n=1 Tax=Spirulina sp. 06S082 TaxID=3110248 RepID=UPI002B2004C1|nr:methyltransferase domain-containing protein [Spirulina sp. 06S082]MEA5470326.1 methyltransferase domain-containing protein [Spirulina sp. 06S082]